MTNLTSQYNLLNDQLKSLLDNEPNPITNMSQFSALIYNELPNLNWAGFYLLQPEGHLQLGPFQGQIACTKIAVGTGVCGTAAKQKRSVLVKDVHQFPGHITCDARSNSELVCPVLKDGQLIGVFDLDSPAFNRFSEQDQIGVEHLVKTLSELTCW